MPDSTRAAALLTSSQLFLRSRLRLAYQPIAPSITNANSRIQMPRFTRVSPPRPAHYNTEGRRSRARPRCGLLGLRTGNCTQSWPPILKLLALPYLLLQTATRPARLSWRGVAALALEGPPRDARQETLLER